jgi:D-alanyl-D-alanine carboxypeptidase (penicillin-binding protein 5/6)
MLIALRRHQAVKCADMRYTLRLAVGIVLALCCGAASHTVAALVPPPPEIKAESHVLVDFHSGRILSQRNADQRVEPASLTKMMAEFVAFSELARGKVALDDEVTISARARSMRGSRMFVEQGSQVPLQDLLQGVIIQSGNDASVAVAEHVAGTVEDFAVLMNRYAKSLGMTNSHFVNAHGLPHPEHYTTARDMSRLAVALISRFPVHYRWHSNKDFTHNGIKQRNRNRLLWLDESVDGVKTGYTEAAGYCLVSSARRGGMRLVSVVMGTTSPNERTNQSRVLLGFGFRNFETHRLYGAGERISSIRVWGGERQILDLGLESDLIITVPRGDYGKLKAGVETVDNLQAPVAAGAQQGTLRIALGEELLAERPLVGLIPIPEGNLWRRLSDSVRLMFE